MFVAGAGLVAAALEPLRLLVSNGMLTSSCMIGIDFFLKSKRFVVVEAAACFFAFSFSMLASCWSLFTSSCQMCVLDSSCDMLIDSFVCCYFKKIIVREKKYTNISFVIRLLLLLLLTYTSFEVAFKTFLAVRFFVILLRGHIWHDVVQTRELFLGERIVH